MESPERGFDDNNSRAGKRIKTNGIHDDTDIMEGMESLEQAKWFMRECCKAFTLSHLCLGEFNIQRILSVLENYPSLAFRQEYYYDGAGFPYNTLSFFVGAKADKPTSRR